MSLPLQVIADLRPFRPYRIDLSALPAARGVEEVDGVPDRLADLPWDPAEGSPLRVALLILPGGGHALALALPALCADAATLDNLAREIVCSYACERGEMAGLEPPLQYTDLAEWQNQLLESPDTAAAIERWREEWRDHGLTARLGRWLPLEKALVPSPSSEAPFSPAVVPVPVAPDLSAALEVLFRAFDLPAASLLLAAWQVALWRGTGEPEVLTGLLHDGRSYEELETALGPFARYLPIHGRIDEAMSLRDLAAAVRDAIAAAAGRQESFSWKLVAGEGLPSSTPDFFPVCFAWEEEPPLHRAAGLEMSLVRRSAVVDRFRLECGGRIGRDGLSLELRYDRSAFLRHDVERLAERLLALLRQAVAQPEARLADLGLPGEKELQWIGRIGRGVPVPGVDDRLHRLFEAQAERTPLRPAVVGDEIELTYAELNARANQLAHHLSRLGVGVETPVALCLERSPAAVVAILAVLKAGGFWIPLDPGHPPERLAFVLEDTAAPVVVTTSRLAGAALEGRSGLRKVLLDTEAPAIAACPAGNQEGGAAGGNLAYTIYTSGSTGVPKGVQVEHRAPAQLLRALTAAVAELGRGPMRASLNAPLTFDASVQQLVLLLAGHTLHIVPEAVRTDGPALLSFLRAGAVDLFDCTPSQLRILLDAGLLEAPGPVPGVVLTAGEAIDVPLWESLLPSRRTVFFNLYGPTECTVDATVHRIGSGAAAPTIGRSLAGYEVLLLDRHLRPVPVGAPGEIGLGGAGLARGYSGRPALTAERFVPHPWGGRPGERLYRTGDLARWLPDGNLEFLGRIDNQIKLRGYRIEPGEIEAALALHPWVEEAVVVAREQPGLREDVRLVAYVRPAAAAPAGLAGAHAELQGFLRQRLPEAMVPASFVPLASFPWTASGKVDRRALASRDLAPASGRPELTTGFVAPGTPFEEVLAAIWQEVLGLERVGARDNFFELGGHSLLATQVIQRARAVLCGSLSVRHLFEQPTVAELAAVAEAEMAAGQSAAPPPIRRSAEPPVLSFAQQRLWFLHQMDPASGTYNIPAAVRCQGRLEPDALAAALTDIVRRHEVLRTRFEAGCAEGRILFSPAGPVDLPVVDLSSLPEEQRRRETAVRVREEARRPFDLEREPLLRSSLLVEGPEEHVVLLTMHHIVSDAWSAGVLIQEMSALYPALRQGRSPQLPELPIQYSDFARWQREWLSGDVLDAEIVWWRERLGEEVRLDLPTDRPRPAVRTFRGSTVSFTVPDGHVAGLRALSRKLGATLFMTLLGAFQALLCRSTGQSQVTVGSPIAGRNHLQTEGLIGFFINTLVLRTDLAGDPVWEGLIARVREVTLGAYLHQDLPFEVLVGELRPERSLSRMPLFEVMFALQNAPAGSLQIPGLTLQQLSAPSEVARLDLSVSFAETAGGLTGLFEYDRDLFDRSTVERLVAHCALLLEGLASDPERRLSQLPLLTPGEMAQLAEWGGTAGEPPPWSVPGLFAEVADRSPGSLAVEAGGEAVTHGELRLRAARVAHRLAEHGVRPGVIVGLYADRSCSLVAGLLGILQAGGAYLPLDPSLPAERLRFLLEDSGARVILASSRVAGDLPEHTARLVVLEEAETSAGDLEVPEVRVAPDDLAYVIYTSGSTGRPKGVLVEHASLASVLAASLREFGWEAGDRVPCLAPFSFDIFLFELLSPLLAGGTCVLLPLRPTLDPQRLLEVLPGATRLHAVPPLMRQIVAAVRREGTACPRLRTLFVGGETVPLELLQEMREVFPHAELRVLYGPTEGTIICSAWTVPAGEVPSRSSIGRPLPGVELRLCDPWGGPVPMGSPGEIWIGGAGVTRGYLGREDLTAERYPTLDGKRFYRTGDLARWLPDGSLAFAGRIDEQVKVRGFRIEPGEIEAVLVEHAGVEAAAVVVDAAAGGHLVAWLVPDAGGSLDLDAVRAFVRERLPDYMVPARFMKAERLPLTRHGKVDRKTLAARLAESDQAPAGSAAEPRTRTEEVLAGIFAATLHRERIGVEDDFFSLGGDSILVLQVVARARQAGLQMTPGQVFTHPTVAGLASVVQTASSGPVEEETVSGPIPLTPVQSLFFERRPAFPERFIQTVLLELGTDGEASAVTTGRLRAVLAHLVARHDALRLRFEPAAGEEEAWRQTGESLAEPPPLLLVDLSAVPEERQLEAVETAAGLEPGLDLGRPPLVRAALFTRGGAAPDLLLLTIHHLAVDGVSWRVLLEDLETAWRQLTAGGPVALPPQTTSFRRWAEHLATMAGSAGVREHAGYWLDRVDEAPAALPRAAEAGEVHTVRVALDPEETRKLLQEVPRAYRTQVQDVLLAALVEAFAGWAGQRRLWLDLEGHGREELPGESLDVSRTVGWLTSVFPVLFDLESAPDPGAALKTAKEQLRAVPARGLSYGLLRFLGKDAIAERLRSLPAPEVLFNYLGQLEAGTPAGGLFRGFRTVGGTGRRMALHAFEITGLVRGGRLWMEWTCRHPGAIAERLAERFVARLRELIAHCMSAVESGLWGYTPSDFPLAHLDQGSLDHLTARAGGEIEDVYPVSPLQQGMLLRSLDAPGSGSYVSQVSLTLDADLDVPVFVGAWERVVRRHSILRTAFFVRELDEPLQVVRRAVSLDWEHQDWRGEPETRLQAWLADDRRRGFDPSRAPLLRFALMRLGERRHQLVWTIHHVLLDGWSFPILLREIFALYQAGLRGTEAELAPARPFRDYIAWLQEQDESAAEPFWRALLAGFAEPTPLGVDLDVPGETRTRDARQTFLPEVETESLRALARHLGLTLNTLVQGAWAILLSRYSGEEDVVFGAVSSGRSAPLAGIDAIVGLFINTLPVRTAVTSGERLIPWLERFQERQAAARQHEHCPLARVQSWSEVPPGRRLFDSILAFENYPVDESVRKELGREIGVAGHDVLDQTDYPLTLMAAPAVSLRLKLLFDPRRMEGAAMTRLLRHLAALLGGMQADPDVRLRDLPLLTPAERHQLALESRGPRPGRGEWVPLHRRFEAVARQIPDAVAVAFSEGALTYAGLDARANHVARRLRRLGIGPDVPVGISAERSLDQIVGVLGVLKAGGAYVPLDPSYPAGRLAFMLEDIFSGVVSPVLLTQRRFAGLLEAAPQPDRIRPAVLCLDMEEAGGVCELPGGSAPEQLAYVLYTSGSTGRPKGVALSGGALGNLLDWHRESGDLGDAAQTLQLAPLGFDVSFQEIFSTWVTGGTLHLVTEEVRRDPVALLEQLGREGIERVFLPVVALHQLAEAAGHRPGVPALALRDVVVAGEQLQITPTISAWLDRLPGCRLHNHYGPTEGHVVTTATLRGDSALWPALPSIGRPVACTDIHLLGPDLEPVPPGVPGELCIGGAQVARGYFGRPALTAERFIPDPFGSPGSRLYRTGDLARRLAAGDLHCMGRIDGQVKIRGFRVEPGEAEVTLAAHPGVRQAVVVVSAPGDGRPRRLVAFFIPEPQATPEPAELRRFLQQRLPDPLVPATLVAVEALPRTSSGKVDRRALARMEVGERGGKASFVAPDTALEQWLAGTWSKILQVEKVGAHDDFFELGGHSLLATQVLSRVRRTFHIELPLQVCFEATTLTALARAILDRESRPGQSEKIARALAKVQSMAAVKGRQETAVGMTEE